MVGDENMETLKKVVLYGIGKLGKKMINAINAHKGELPYEIVAYMDKNKGCYLGHDIIGLEMIKNLTYDYIVVSSETYYENIKNELVEKYFVEPSKIVHWLWMAEGKNYYCNICQKSAAFFWTLETNCELFKFKKVVGGGARENAICPFCNSMDRFRWFQYVLETQTDIYTRQNKILHFAPEPQIADKIRQKNPEYLSADIVEGMADVVEDITSLSFPNQTFDYIIFNHVLEHIKEEGNALQEVKRCIKSTGKIILSVPICWDEKTFERDDVFTPKEREKYYGQIDHVRLYGYDFQQRMEEYGFEVQRCSFHYDEHGEDFRKLSLLENDTIWILRKKEE